MLQYARTTAHHCSLRTLRPAAQPPRPGGAGNVSFASLNLPGSHLWHYAELVYVAANSGAQSWDNPASYDADVTWNNATPWSAP